MSLKKVITVSIFILIGSILSSCASTDKKTEMEEISEIAAKACGGHDKIESVAADGFTYKD